MRYFTIKELCRSANAEKHGLRNDPPEEAVRNLEELVLHVLDPLRSAWGAPIYVSSGYRNERVNALAKGAKNSQHLYGQAADISAGSPEKNKRLFELALCYDYDQLIDEYGYQWLHISYRADGKNRRQVIHETKKKK